MREAAEQFREFHEAVSDSIPGPLLLRAVLPKTLVAYLEALPRFMEWRRATGESPLQTVGELDDSLGH